MLLNYDVHLTDGNRWCLSFDDETQDWGQRLAQMMRLTVTTPDGSPKIRFHGVKNAAVADRLDDLALLYNFGSLRMYRRNGNVEVIGVVENHNDDPDTAIVNMWFALSPLYIRSIQAGGLLFHAALVERDGQGVLLAAPGGIGKSTCARRIPSPWRALCDDEVLIVRDPHSKYYVHPFPTWSQFLWGKQSDSTWDVQSSAPLCAIFFFHQAATDACESLQQGQAAGYLNDAANQTCRRIWLRMRNQDQRAALTTQIFHNACDLAQNVPAFRLGLSLEGQFWKELERALGSSQK